ncbi:hypothetical protein [Micrococcus luteus]|uniref:hypothetical protein n=1 Tax=Micrococcus luteus TaxID=1270 RepID=UPI0033208D20
MKFGRNKETEAYLTGIQDQLSTAAKSGDKKAVLDILEKVSEENPNLGIILGEQVVNDSLRKMTR